MLATTLIKKASSQLTKYHKLLCHYLKRERRKRHEVSCEGKIFFQKKVLKICLHSIKRSQQIPFQLFLPPFLNSNDQEMSDDFPTKETEIKLLKNFVIQLNKHQMLSKERREIKN